jgi:hypothetical protein
VTSGRQRRRELQNARKEKTAREKLAVAEAARAKDARNGVPVSPELLAAFNSYGQPDWLRRGYYLDTPFRCADCGKDEVWTATQQKWWFEVAKGYAYSTAIRCRACRKADREKRERSGRKVPEIK